MESASLFRCCSVVLLLVLLTTASSREALGTGGFVPDSLVEFTITNTTGQDANDLHVDIQNLDPESFGGPQASVGEGFDVSTFLNSQVNGGMVDFSGGLAKDGETVRVSYGARGAFAPFPGPFGTLTTRFLRMETGIQDHRFTLGGEDIGSGTSANVMIKAELNETANTVDVSLVNPNPFPVGFASTTLFSAPSTFYAPGLFNSDEALNNADFHFGLLLPEGSIPPEANVPIAIVSAGLIESILAGSSAASDASASESPYLAIDVLLTDFSGSGLLGRVSGAIQLVPEPAALPLLTGLLGVVLLRRRHEASRRR